MGFKNFSTILREAKEAVSQQHYSTFAGQVIAIDASIFCYRFSYNPQSKKPNSHIDGFYQLFYRFLKYRIRPIVVFDGHSPTEKKHTLEERTEQKQKKVARIEALKCEIDTLTTTGASGGLVKEKNEELQRLNKNVIHFQPSLYEDLKHLCVLMNVPFIQANGESDALCCKLYQTGQVQGILSEDADMILYGGGKLLRKFTWREETLEVVDLQMLLQLLKISYEQLIDLAILCGTDYTTTTITGLGPVQSLRLLQQGSTLERIIQTGGYQIPDEKDFPYKEAKQLILTAKDREQPPTFEPFDFKQVNADALIALMSEKCHYRPQTIRKHYETLCGVYVPIPVHVPTIPTVKPILKLRIQTLPK
jgi:flap endonuclease-1